MLSQLELLGLGLFLTILASVAPFVKGQTCTTSSTICLSAPLHSPTRGFQAYLDCATLIRVLSGSMGGVAWTASYCQPARAHPSISATVTTPDAMFYSCVTVANDSVPSK